MVQDRAIVTIADYYKIIGAYTVCQTAPFSITLNVAKKPVMLTRTWDPRPRPRPWGIKAKAKDLSPKAKAKDSRCQGQ